MLYVSNAFPSFCLVPSFGTKLYFPSSEGFWNSSYYVLISQIKAFSAAFIRSLHEVLPHDQNTVSRWWPFIILINHNNRSPRLLLSSEDNHLTSYISFIKTGHRQTHGQRGPKICFAGNSVMYNCTLFFVRYSTRKTFI